MNINLLKKLLITFHNKLMCSANHINLIISAKFFNNISTKNITCTSLTDSKSLYIFFSILPSGSLHIRSHISPSWGTSYFLSIPRISSMLLKDGDSPPCTQNKEFSTTAARDKRSKISVQYFQTFKDPYFLKHSS